MRARLLGITLVLVACGSSGGAADDTSPSAPAGPPGAGQTPGASASPVDDSKVAGVWTVTGKDDRGTYAGKVELVVAGDGYRFTRVIRYDTVKVEDGRELHWVWEGAAVGTREKLRLTSALDPRGFVVSRGGLTRALTDAPIAVSATFTAGPGSFTGTFTGPGIVANETWTARVDSGAQPIFAGVKRTVVPAHDPPSSSKKATLFASFADFRGKPEVAPYANRPEFQAAVHGWVVDPTDLDFYRANPNALRVIDRPIDAISLAEATMRANAYRYTLAEKAAHFQADLDAKFMDPAVGMVVDGGPPAGPFEPSGDSSLWTGTYVAAQAWQYLVTKDPKTLDRIATSVNALLVLQEITGDWTQFARTLRKATGNATDKWHAGTGAYAAYDWLEGGNNDMIKGLYYGLFMGWKTLCQTPTGHASLCDRIQTNVKHIADDLAIGKGHNTLTSNWLAAVVRGELTYQVKALTDWPAEKIALQNNPIFYDNGISDWSGNNLVFTSNTIERILAEEKDLNGEAIATLKSSIDASHANVARQRFMVWHLFHASYGSGAKSGPFIDDMKLRLAEVPYPKLAFDVDHRVDPAFCMSPYPSLPWKNDWMQNDRTATLNQYPIFEMPVDVSYPKQGPSYAGAGGSESPGTDFLHVYWYARAHGLLTAAD